MTSGVSFPIFYNFADNFFFSACANVPTEITEFGLKFTISDFFTISTYEACTKIRISSIPVESFQQEISKTYSSLAIVSETQQASNKQMFVYNEQSPSMLPFLEKISGLFDLKYFGVFFFFFAMLNDLSRCSCWSTPWRRLWTHFRPSK